MENNKLFDTVLIEQYLQGNLDARRMHELEKQALEDPFLYEAWRFVSNRGLYTHV